MRNSVVLIEEFISGITFELLITSFYGVIFIINFYVPIYSQIRFYVLYREIYSQRKYTLMDEHVKYLIVWHFFKASNVNCVFCLFVSSNRRNLSKDNFRGRSTNKDLFWIMEAEKNELEENATAQSAASP